MAAIAAGPGGELAGRRAGFGCDDKDIGVDGAVGIGVLVADKRDPRAVGRPDTVILLDILGSG